MLLTPIFLIKLCLTPLLMWGVSVAAKKWGTFWGGLLSGLPLTSGVILTFLAVEQGAGFTQHAILGAIPGLAAVMAAYWTYVCCSKRYAMWLTGLAALAAFVLMSLLLTRLHTLALDGVLLLVSMAVIIRKTGREYRAQTLIVKRNPWDLPLRMGASTALLLLITSAAPHLGSIVSGVLATIPVIAWPLTLFTHAQYGRNEMLTVVRGNAIGALGVLGFYAVMYALLPHWHLLPVVLAAAVISVALPLLLSAGLKRVAV